METVKTFLGIGEGLTAYTLMIDFAIASLFILIGQLLRAKVKIIQKWFLPASMMAGFMGLFLGPHFLNVLPFSGSQSSYVTYLIIVVFAIVGLDGFDFSKRTSSGKDDSVVKGLIGFQMYKIVALLIQFILPFVATLLIIKKIWPEVNDGIAILLAAGFDGGAGTAAAVGATFNSLGWSEATDLGMTTATFGVLAGIFGGILWIKWATKRGVTNFIKDYHNIDQDTRTGLISTENRTSIGSETMNPVSLDTLCFHLSLVLVVAVAGCFINAIIGAHLLSGIPDFTIAYLLGLVIFLLFHKTKLYNYYDSRVTNKISGTCTDYLVFFGIATINPSVVVKYAGPLAILIISGIICACLTVIPLGNLMIRHSWFEKSMFIFGYSTGVFANSFILLRMIDPKYESGTVEEIAATPFNNFVEMVLWSMVPQLLLAGQGWLVVGVCTIGVVVCLAVSIALGVWYPSLPLAGRDKISVDAETVTKAERGAERVHAR